MDPLERFNSVYVGDDVWLCKWVIAPTVYTVHTNDPRNLPIESASSSNSLSRCRETSPPLLNSSMDDACGRCSSVLVRPSLDNLPTPSPDSSDESALSNALQLSRSFQSFNSRGSSRPLINALDSCTILYHAAKSSTDPVVRESLLSQHYP